MSQSTVAAVGFSIQSSNPPAAVSNQNADSTEPNSTDEPCSMMQQSQMIDNLFETSDLTKSTRPLISTSNASVIPPATSYPSPDIISNTAAAISPLIASQFGSLSCQQSPMMR
ncbi:unnamed protein product [Anisakis simplex]|uniref:Ovule protein n=1 Tax=Anisakis simplex TaxID=6269 RepID=A0A0M3JG86_ANISI|nr:unnamed protein product [Anisakis simplex]